MFIQTENTPNPNAIKFLPNIIISPDQPIYFNRAADVNNRSNLATQLFTVKNVKSIFFGQDFITITKEDDGNWLTIKPEILMIMMDHFVAGFEALEKTSNELNTQDTDAQISDIEKQIIEIINTRVRPSVAMDGGDIIYKGFVNGKVLLELHGSCAGCPSSTITLKNGIETMLKHFVPEVESVEAVE